MIRRYILSLVNLAINVFCFVWWCSGAKEQALGPKWLLLEAAKFTCACAVLGLFVFGLIQLGCFLASKGCDQ